MQTHIHSHTHTHTHTCAHSHMYAHTHTHNGEYDLKNNTQNKPCLHKGLMWLNKTSHLYNVVTRQSSTWSAKLTLHH